MQTWEITIITDRHRETITAEADAITLQQHQDFVEIVAILSDENEPTIAATRDWSIITIKPSPAAVIADYLDEIDAGEWVRDRRGICWQRQKDGLWRQA